MEHIAIMKKSWGLTQKILSGKKKIESRWYTTKVSPWDRIKIGETIYFKDSGGKIKVKAIVEQVIQFSDLTSEKVKEILNTYGPNIGIGIDNIHPFFERFKDKKYCILIFLKNPQAIEPFNIDKTGFGARAAWISVECVRKLKVGNKFHGLLSQIKNSE